MSFTLKSDYGLIYFDNLDICLKCDEKLQEYCRKHDGKFIKLWKRCPKCRIVYQIWLKGRGNE